jgi:hypothetical protein
MDYWMAAAPACAALFVGMLICLEAGRRLGVRNLAKNPEKGAAGTGSVEGAVFGLYALLLAFSFSGAAGRFDTRRQLIAQEANAIGTAYLRLDLLPPESQPPLRDRFRRYLDVRLEASGAQTLEALATILARTAALQGDIWAQALATARLPGAHPDATKLLLPALNDMIDIVTTRLIAARSHPPLLIFVIMFALALLCGLLAGYGMAAREPRSMLHITAFAVITVLSLYLVIDMEYPRRGFIRLDRYDQVMVELRQSMK